MSERKNNNLIIFAKNRSIELDEYLLRPLDINDLVDYHEFTSDEETLKYDYPAHKTLEESLQMLVVWNLAQPLGKYGIEQKKTGKIIGNASLKLSDEGNLCEIGYTLNKNYWRRGIAYTCISALIDFAFLNLTIERIIAKVHEENISSITLLKKLGFRLVEKNKADSLREREFTELTYSLNKSDYTLINPL